MRRISPIKTAVALGSVTGLWHLSWALLVGAGWAKPVLDFILELHFIKVSYALASYSVTTAGSLVLLTFAIGALMGFVFALIWNWLTLESAAEWTRGGRKSPALNQPF